MTPAWPVRKKSRASEIGISRISLMFLPRSSYVSTSGVNRLPSHCSHTEDTPAIITRSV